MSQSIAEAWFGYNRSKADLKAALGHEDDLASALGEYLVSAAYGKPSSTITYKATKLSDQKTVLTRSAVRTSDDPIQLPAIENWDFDYLSIVIFDEDGYIETACEMPTEQARELAVFNKSQNNWYIVYDDNLYKRGFVSDISLKFETLFNGSFLRKAKEDNDAVQMAGREDPLSLLKNKAFALKCLQLLKDYSSNLDSDISKLQNESYCKQILGHSQAILRRVTGLSNEGLASVARDGHGNRRYYEDPIPLGFETYIISNDWYGLGVTGRNNREPFIKWVRERTSEKTESKEAGSTEKCIIPDEHCEPSESDEKNTLESMPNKSEYSGEQNQSYSVHSEDLQQSDSQISDSAVPLLNQQRTIENAEKPGKKDWVSVTLAKAKLQYEDKREDGGCLWVYGAQDLSKVLEVFERHGAKFIFSENGSKATNRKPAWWLKGYPALVKVSEKDNSESKPKHLDEIKPGDTVNHIRFGSGRVRKINRKEGYIVVFTGGKKRKFPFPESFNQGFLSLQYTNKKR